MFDIAWSEFLVVAVVALVVVGPKDLPALLRTVGKTVATLRRMAGDFQSQFNEALKEAELDELQRDITGLKNKASTFGGGVPDPIKMARDEIHSALSYKPPSALAGDKAETAADAPSALAPPPPEIEPGTLPSPAGGPESRSLAAPAVAKPDDETIPPGALS
ncbi:Sec-independent protein translocase protein TatB [Hansschlegelia quercus]|uniref:Sec-independent protein translocase protein TatB n=1 Tax=Hansschlegelia quercus TaxID=2528245 RepID=A0A4Q9GRI0_9HYPH|nr:Sec-independent protein translocase protein TatB [Hansschlegelia quercus]TBN54357.1 twin-arginine translocase subunit TatB [Hansschlegelia quercus]